MKGLNREKILKLAKEFIKNYNEQKQLESELNESENLENTDETNNNETNNNDND